MSKKILCLVVGVFFVAAGGIAYATIPDANGVVHGCYTNQAVQGQHALWVADTTCPAGSTALPWDQQGRRGPTGPAGSRGAVGPTGPAGSRGIAGPTGPAGAEGRKGATGPQGPNGTAGAPGAVGPQGQKGDRGPTGPAGPPGGGMPSLDSLQGLPCDNGNGTVHVAYGSWTGGTASITLTCVGVSRTLTVTTSLQGGASGTVTSSPAGISCPGTCSASFPNGVHVTLTASSASDFTWSGDCSGGGTCELTMDASKTVTASFSPGKVLTVSTSFGGQSSGTITSSPAGISCPGTCTAAFPTGTNVTLTPTSQADVFTGWSGDCSGGGACQLTMDAAKNATASFAEGENLTLTMTRPPSCFWLGNSGGCRPQASISSSPAGLACGPFNDGDPYHSPPNPQSITCTGRWQEGTPVTLTSTSYFGDTPVWLGACAFNVGSTCSVGWGSRFETATAQYSYP